MIDEMDIVIFGVGLMASIVRASLERDSPYRVVAFTADRDHVDRSTFEGLDVIPFDEVVSRLPPRRYGMFVAIGYSRVNGVRAARCQQAHEMGYELISNVSARSSTWPHLRVGPNTIVMEDCTIGPGVAIGAGCIIWPRCYVGHGVEIGDYCYLAANSSVSGLSVIGPRCILSTGCVIRNETTVGEACVVGAGAVLMRDLDAHSVVAAPHPRYLAGASDRLMGQ
jgi:sugar O-acyltransferase (sialic acid O-acetyltransferase NeuD family)